jgi:hypothetical protein
MVNKSTEFKKNGRKTKGPKGKRPQKGGNYVAGPPKAPKAKPEVTCFYYKEDGHWKRNYPKYLKDNKAGNIAEKDKVICDIHVIDIYIRENKWYCIPALSMNIVSGSRLS